VNEKPTGELKLLIPLFFYPRRMSSGSGDFTMHNGFAIGVAIHGAILSDLHPLRSDSIADICERHDTVSGISGAGFGSGIGSLPDALVC
jgi:hypothetical protein